ncbi:MAG: hypothetical protein JOZ73_02035, partial [Solirubrobacterales bacterium]|nr:hypothetical protein [Solirubrobacterales bacterium]
MLGVGISLALLVAWGTATFRALRPPPPEKASADPEWTGASALAADRDSTSASTLAADRGSTSTERAGLSTLLCVVVVFGVHSAIDWTWFIPGTTVAALLCAGWLAGRGPVEQRGRLRAYRRPSSPRPISARPGAVVAIASVVVLSLLAAWVIWQPLR